MEHEHCTKEGDIATLRTEVGDLKKIVKGNGQKGLQAQVTELNTILPSLKTSVDTLSATVTELVNKGLIAEGVNKEKMTNKQKLSAIIAGIIGASATIVMIADLILKNK